VLVLGELVVTWDYRVVMRNGEYAIYEVYYHDAGNVEAVTDAPVYPAGTSIEELGKDLQYYQQALKQSVLNYDELSKQLMDSQTPPKVLIEAKRKGTVPWEQIKAELQL
jgi:hypothetical protein